MLSVNMAMSNIGVTRIYALRYFLANLEILDTNSRILLRRIHPSLQSTTGLEEYDSPIINGARIYREAAACDWWF